MAMAMAVRAYLRLLMVLRLRLNVPLLHHRCLLRLIRLGHVCCLLGIVGRLRRYERLSRERLRPDIRRLMLLRDVRGRGTLHGVLDGRCRTRAIPIVLVLRGIGAWLLSCTARCWSSTCAHRGLRRGACASG